MTVLGLFLSDDAVKELTGYSYPSRQIGRLRELGLVEGVRADFVVGRDGRPKVYLAAVGRRDQKEEKERQTAPDFSALG